MKKKALHGDIPFLPEEIIVNILKRLPVKSLIRFQCVCKQWKTLVKSPSFIADHLHHSSNQSPRVLFKRHRANPFNLFMVKYNEMMQAALDVQMPLSMSNLRHDSIIGSCNGLVCVRSASLLFLWNPATREERRIPGVIKDANFNFGFGFSPIVNDYKIVKILKSYSAVKNVEVYSLNTDSWREIEFGSLEVLQFCKNVSVNGSIFWYVLKNPGAHQRLISFDIAKEVFTWVPVPTLDNNNPCSWNVIGYAKKLALLCSTYQLGGGFQRPLTTEIWAMEEGVDDASGKKWSWTKMDNNSPLFRTLYTYVNYVSSYVESLVPINSQ